MNSSTLSGKRVLVTGGGGFIGSHLMPRLINAGAEVTVVELKDQPPWRLAAHGGAYILIAADIADANAVSAVFSAVKPHAVVHLAAYGVDAGAQDVTTAVQVNVSGIANVLSAMHICGCPRLVTLGSGAEYGNHEGAIGEDATLRPQSVYASTKAAATLIAHQYAAQYGIGIVTLRPFGIYGEAEPPHKLFCHVILKMLRDEELKLTPCKQQRDYCYAGDIAQAIVMALENDSLRNNIFNLGTGQLNTLEYYIEEIRRIINPECAVEYGALPYRENEIWAACPDLRRVRERLGWQSSHSLKDALEKTVGWFRGNLHHYCQNSRDC